MQNVQGDPSDLSFRARVWTSALNKQPDFARQSVDQRAASRNKSETHVVRKRPYRLDLRDVEAREPDDANPVQARARTSLDVEEDSFVLRPATSANTRQENFGLRSKRSAVRRQDQMPSYHSNASGATPQHQREDLQPVVAQPDHEKSLAVRITEIIHGHRERPAERVALNRTHSESRRLHRTSKKGHRRSQPQIQSQDVDSDTLTRADSVLSRARRAFSTGTTRPTFAEQSRNGFEEHGRGGRSRTGRPHSTDGRSRNAEVFENGENFLGVDVHRDPFEPDRGASSRRANSLRREQPSSPSEASGVGEIPQQGRTHRRSYVDWDPIRHVGRRSARNFRPPEADNRHELTRSDASATRALQRRVRELEEELAAATAESRQMASQLAQLRKESATAKNTIPILEEVIRKSRQHFESKERALRLTISAMAADFEGAIKTRNEALRALSNHTGRPVILGSNRNQSVSAGSARKRGGESRKRRPSSWGSLEGSTAARRLRELEELSDPKSAPRLAVSAADRPPEAGGTGPKQSVESSRSNEVGAANVE